MSENNQKLTKKELRKFSLRYAITAQASQSYEAMQGIACVYSMGPFFEKWFADDPDLMQKVSEQPEILQLSDLFRRRDYRSRFGD